MYLIIFKAYFTNNFVKNFFGSMRDNQGFLGESETFMYQ
jgi:hypothetical protein